VWGGGEGGDRRVEDGIRVREGVSRPRQCSIAHHKHSWGAHEAWPAGFTGDTAEPSAAGAWEAHLTALPVEVVTCVCVSVCVWGGGGDQGKGGGQGGG
jgi:hypothetical protein